jgi:hypothetical protein
MSSPTLYIVRNSPIKKSRNTVQIAHVLFTHESDSVPRSVWVLPAYLKPRVKTLPDGLYFLTVIKLVEGQDARLLHLVTKINHWS